jgi:chemotaxis protein CheC
MMEQALQLQHVQLLQQLTDIAFKEAAVVMSALSQQEVSISVINCRYLEPESLLSTFENTDSELISVSQKVSGAVEGQAMLLIETNSAMQLIRDLLREQALLRDLTEMEEEALTEIGNILINSCISNYSQLCGQVAGSQLPMLNRGLLMQLLMFFSDQVEITELLAINMDISVDNRHFQCYLVMNGWALERLS